MIALSVAAVLAVFIVYTSIAGAGTPQISPSDLPNHHGDVEVAGTVVGPVSGDAHGAGLRFALKNDGRANPARAHILYKGTVPDLFKVGRHVVVEGTFVNGVFVAKANTLVTKCPSRYTPAKST